MKDDKLLDFVKARLEDGEGIAPEALCRLLAAAERPAAPARRNPSFAALLVAASLAIAAGGWFFAADFADARRERHLTDVIILCCAADGEASPSPAPLPDYLLAWQDASAQLGDIE